MKNNILSLVSYKLRKLKREKETPLEKRKRYPHSTESYDHKFQILKLRKEIDLVHKLVMSL